LPDVAVTQEGYRAYKQNPLPSDLLLVAEVSDSSLKPDLATKANVYARAGITEYWVVDVEGRRVVTHRKPSETEYNEIIQWDEGEQIAPLANPTAFIAVSELFPE
jgi:Uma2 family endonuclease